MKRLLLSIAATLALAAVAMPTRDEQRKAAPIVAELMNPLVADFRAKKKTAAEVGDVAMTYAREANTEAAKFLLLKGAIWYFAQAKEDAKAVAAIAALGTEVKELPPEVLRNDVLKPAIDHVSEQNVPGLFAQFRSASALMEIAKLGPSVRRNKADEPTRRRYAELLVVTGDWKGALDVFAQLDDAKDAAQAESVGKTLAPAGDFWWNYRPTEPTAANAIKAHAVALYRKAIASGELTGLKKVVAEKRIASTPFADSFAAAETATAPAPSAAPSANALYCVVDLSAGPNASKYPVSYLAAEPKGGWTDEYKTKKLVLRRIEPGTFMMGGKYEVTLTKPFYMGVFEVTQKQYELVTGSNPSEFKGDTRPVERVSWDAIRGDSATYNWPSSANVDPSTFMGKIQARTGLNFDLPTEAQWEYACRAGTTSPYNNGGDSEADLRKLGRFMFNQKARVYKESDADFARHEPDGKGGCLKAHTVVGSYLPNAWGLYDMHGNVWEWCLDVHGNLPGTTDTADVSSKTHRRLRGGSWNKGADRSTSSGLSHFPPSSKLDDYGFRLCMNPEGLVGTSARGSGTLAASGALYCVVDLSAGPNASKYPVSYLAAEPKGGWTDEYKTKKLVLRRIEPGTFMMGGKYEVTLTKPFYMGVFEVTQKQYELVTGSNPSQHKGDMRPVEKVSWNAIRGDSATCNWPSSVNVDSSTFIGKIQARTGLNFDLPTEAQWEYACRAGTTSKYNNGGDSEADLKQLGRFVLNQKARGHKESAESFAKHEPDGKGGCMDAHTIVGSYLPNAWGLYDMHGNVWEWCLDWHGDLSSEVTDPIGPSSGASRVVRGGCWDCDVDFCTSSSQRDFRPLHGFSSIGFRLARTLSK